MIKEVIMVNWEDMQRCYECKHYTQRGGYCDQQGKYGGVPYEYCGLAKAEIVLTANAPKNECKCLQ